MPLDDTIRIRVSKDLKDSLQAIADADGRSLSNLGKFILEKYARDHRTAAMSLNDKKPLITYPRRKTPHRHPPMKTLACLLALLLTACAEFTEARVNLIPLAPNNGEFLIIHPGEQPPHPYKEISVFTYEAGAPDAADKIAAMVKRARALGADALILRLPITTNHNWADASAITYNK